jgi:hypothetical protein
MITKNVKLQVVVSVADNEGSNHPDDATVNKDIVKAVEAALKASTQFSVTPIYCAIKSIKPA